MVRLNLGTKFSLFLGLVWLLGSVLTIFTLANHLNAQAEQAVKERAEILLTAMQAARNYTRNNIQPLLEMRSSSKNSFTPESIPNFAARTIFEDFRQQDPNLQDFSYKEAALNPTSPLDLADPFEADIFTQLQQQVAATEPEMAESKLLFGYRTASKEKLFYLARPLIMKDASCLRCHGHPSQAPQSLVDMYGNQGGFGWELGDMVAAQMVYVPANEIFNQGRQNLFTVTKTLLSIFAALFVVVNLLLWRNVIQPLKILTNVAKQISQCSINPNNTQHLPPNLALETLTRQPDEPGQLARAFQYMVHVLGQREQDLQQAVDEQTQSLKQEMRDRQTAQEALQTYSHAINHDLRNLVMGISNLVQAILLQHSQGYRSRSQNKAAGEPYSSLASQAKPTSQTEAAATIHNPKVQTTPLQAVLEVAPTALEMIQKSCDRQLKLMNSLVEVQSSDIWRIVLQPEPVDLRRLTEELRMAYETKLLHRPSRVENHVPIDLPVIQADSSQIQRVFENLIENALKYNPEGVTVILSATPIWSTSPEPGSHPSIRCAVSDNGIGIDPAKSQEVFQVYARGTENNQVTGYGLGLYICRKIVEAHDGSIGILALPGGGVEVWFTLPLRLI